MKRKRKRTSKRKPFPRKWKIALAVLACGVVALGGLAYGGYELKQWVATLDMFRVKKASMTNAPDWLPPSVKNQLEEIPSLKKGVSIFEPDLLLEIQANYVRSGWVKEVESVRKSFPDKIRCKLELRRPCGAVLSKWFYLTDFEGVRLPGAYEKWPSEGFDGPMITGTRGPVPPVRGTWQDESLHAAVAVLKVLSASGVGKKLQIKSIDVSNLGGKVNRGESDIVVRTAEGVEVWWGRRPGSKRMGERPAGEKVAELNEIVREDSLEKYRYIDLRFEPAVKMLR